MILPLLEARRLVLVGLSHVQVEPSRVARVFTPGKDPCAMPIDPNRTLAGLVLEQPARSRVLEELGLDYCCGGKRTLAEACASLGIDAAKAAAALAAAENGGGPESVDWSREPLAALCDHIVSTHHARLRKELPRLSGILEKVVRAHGASRSELVELRQTFEEMRAGLETHMADEEERLFPACRAGAPIDDVSALEEEHAATGAALERLRELTRDHDLEAVLCNRHRAAVDGLRELELDLHRHIHEENNILFPRALASAD
jgi:regulator of cell morphogenesis and NO signaling